MPFLIIVLPAIRSSSGVSLLLICDINFSGIAFSVFYLLGSAGVILSLGCSSDHEWFILDFYQSVQQTQINDESVWDGDGCRILYSPLNNTPRKAHLTPDFAGSTRLQRIPQKITLTLEHAIYVHILRTIDLQNHFAIELHPNGHLSVLFITTGVDTSCPH